jgi:hypothetical protein
MEKSDFGNESTQQALIEDLIREFDESVKAIDATDKRQSGTERQEGEGVTAWEDRTSIPDANDVLEKDGYVEDVFEYWEGIPGDQKPEIVLALRKLGREDLIAFLRKYGAIE